MKIKVTKKQMRMLLNNPHWLRKGVGLYLTSDLFKKIMSKN